MLHSLILLNLFLLTKCSPSVVIVGAGAAGIAAATKLLENQITNITILEAENRIGGRIKSVEFGGSYVDLGAEFCHGRKDNIVYSLVKDLDVLRVANYTQSIYYSNGLKVEDDIQGLIFNAFDEFYNNLNYAIANKTEGEAFLAYYGEHILEKYINNPEKLKKLVEAIWLIEKWILIYKGAFFVNQPSSETRYRVCEGPLEQNWNGLGYKTILEVLMKSYPDSSKKLPIDDKIFLNKNVVEIDWDRKFVKTSDNSTYFADYIIFTASVGVLKHRHLSLFNPQLPQRKIEAIEEIGFDGIMRIYLRYPENWWSDLLPLHFLWSDEDLKQIPEEFNSFSNGKSWLFSIVVALQFEYNKNVVALMAVGPAVPMMETLPPESFIRGIKYIFGKFLRRGNITDPIEIIFSNWCRNPNFMGTYSYETVEGYKRQPYSNQEELARPLINGGAPVVLFAGEATHPEYFSTVHSAIETGYREAERIINLTASKNT